MKTETEKVTAITWDRLQHETNKDADMHLLIEAINEGFPDTFRTSPSTSCFWQYRDRLYIAEGVFI